MRLVIIESPFAGDEARNLKYVRACMHDCLTRGDAPFASHALYTQPGVLDDDIAHERELGITAGFDWRQVAECTVVYADLGVTRGMRYGIADALARSSPIEIRSLYKASVPPLHKCGTFLEAGTYEDWCCPKCEEEYDDQDVELLL